MFPNQYTGPERRKSARREGSTFQRTLDITYSTIRKMEAQRAEEKKNAEADALVDLPTLR